MKALRDQGTLRLDAVRLNDRKVVRRIVELRAKKTTLGEIAAHFTSSSVPTRRGSKWSAEQIRSILERAKTRRVPQYPATAA